MGNVTVRDDVLHVLHVNPVLRLPSIVTSAGRMAMRCGRCRRSGTTCRRCKVGRPVVHQPPSPFEQDHRRLPHHPLQLHDHQKAQAEPLACITTRMLSVPYRGGPLGAGRRRRPRRARSRRPLGTDNVVHLAVDESCARRLLGDANASAPAAVRPPLFMRTDPGPGRFREQPIPVCGTKRLYSQRAPASRSSGTGHPYNQGIWRK